MKTHINWKKLQNGSDIRGVAMDGIPGEEINLTCQVAEKLGRAFAHWLHHKTNLSTLTLTVAVGTDSRLTGPSLKKAFVQGLVHVGVDVYDCGIASTPAMFMATVDEDYCIDAGVMLTASHLPFNRNGFKFFTPEGGANKSDITEILQWAARDHLNAISESGVVKELDYISTYSNHLVHRIRSGVQSKVDKVQPLKGLKIIVDAGNGAGGFFAKKVLEKLGADTNGSQFLDPDGNFPNHVPNPEDEVAMKSISDAVIREKADLGIIFDTDVDRSAIVDKQGNSIHRNELIALISAIVLEEHPGSTVVTDSITSDGLTWFIQTHLKGKHKRFKRGYKNVINESLRLNTAGEESWLAIETSGHAALKENYFLDDGAFLVAKLLMKMADLRLHNKELSQLINELPKPIESKEFRLKIKTKDFISYGQSVIAALENNLSSDWEKVSENYEGIRVQCKHESEDGWFLLRLSLHDPVIPINIESNVRGGVEVIVSKLKHILELYIHLDLSPLN
ncbi:phosphomannomutase/phosphoglucomutase [Saccharicrinis fermentans DSM 9555 = JCM 21142]|uniref:Phosphomannomutase/phosphoglucomutase n=2 Tax=Saccharicrinis fermentans TaxID=982 RepID=W7Y1Z2_9BACT|nr:phosphomannomutase/phosphoglucomutase [Saccharicrinis fermentans DSM 9555 = JCM 21142]